MSEENLTTLKDVFDDIAKDAMKSLPVEVQKDVQKELQTMTVDDLKKLFNGESYKTKEVDISYEVCMKTGSSSTEWDIDADELVASSGLLYFKRKNEIVFIAGISNIIYINPKED